MDWAEAELKIERSVYETAGGGWQEKSTKTHQSGTVSLVGVDEDGNMVEAGLELLRRHRATVDDLADRLGLVVPANAFMFSLSPIGSEPIRPDFVTKRFTALCRTMEKPALARLRRTNPKATRADLDPADRWDLHIHQLRHFTATDAFAKGADAITVSRRLRHKDPSVTMRIYAHAVVEKDRSLSAALGRTLALPGAR